MHLSGEPSDLVWSSRGLAPRDAFRNWQDWASHALAPMHIDVPEPNQFAAYWRSSAIGALRLIELQATPQTVRHEGERGHDSEPTFQLLYCAKAPIASRVGQQDFRVGEGEFVLVDNAEPYEMRMAAHRAIDVVMPVAWLKRWLPDPHQCTARPYSGSEKWGLPLASLLRAIAGGLDDASLPRAVIADQLGALLALAVGPTADKLGTYKSGLLQRIKQAIAERYAEPELDPASVAATIGISKRYLHSLLASSGATFLGLLRDIRLERARGLLADPRFDGRQIGEIAWLCGYLDPSYFARVFRRQFGAGPREWRAMRKGH